MGNMRGEGRGLCSSKSQWDRPIPACFAISYIGSGAIILLLPVTRYLLPVTCLKVPSPHVTVRVEEIAGRCPRLGAQGLTLVLPPWQRWTLSLIGHGRLSGCLIIREQGGSHAAITTISNTYLRTIRPDDQSLFVH